MQRSNFITIWDYSYTKIVLWFDIKRVLGITQEKQLLNDHLGTLAKHIIIFRHFPVFEQIKVVHESNYRR